MKTCRHKLFPFLTAIAALATAVTAFAQTRDITVATTEQTWDGTAAGTRAGAWLDQGTLRARTLVTDQRKDLIVGAPGGPGIVGAVYVIYGGPVRTGEQNLATADTIITGESAGDLFGTATAAGDILKQDGLNPGNLVVGAPAASGGRGAVYLFAANFANGDSLTTANAVLKVIGAAGDQLGSILATGDLDNDGYREIIIGAPGNQRVYVIKGGPSLSGVVDLSVTPAARTISLPGIGSVMTAGDVTGDGIYDLLVAAPAQNTVYLFPGATGAIPATASATFTGLDANDAAGTSLRVADMDADGHRDILIGAPAGDGSDNTRTDAGEVYLIWGGTSLTSRSLGAADVIFYGRPGERLGAAIAAGDVTRDAPNDAVMLAQSAASGNGILYLYYGGPRTSFGVAQPSGQRVVDFTDDAQVSRRIISDQTVGPITSAQVFEVTGEGARDVIVGVPSVNGDTGRVYFTLSPKMVLSNNLYNVTLTQGTSRILGVQIQNPTTIPITWTITSNSAWLNASPAAGSSVETVPATISIMVSAATLAAGSYVGTLTVSSTSPDLAMALPITVNLTVTAPTGAPVPAPTGDFDGDARSNRAVFRPSSATWVIAPSTTVQFGSIGDIPVAGDYDGNGVVDLAVFHPATGEWLIRNQPTVQLGRASDIPVPADYTGDRKTDPAVYRTSDDPFGYWLFVGQSPLQFGLRGDIPVPADYDGDGKADIAVYRPTNGTWYVLNSSNSSVTVTQFGSAGDIPVVADYDGDGKADVAVFRTWNGIWYVMQSEAGFTFMPWGVPGDVPLATDSDGDRIPELTIWRPSTATWYEFNRVTGDITSGVWGATGDLPAVGRPRMASSVTKDFDGDGRSDLLSYRPSDGTWYIAYSSTGFGSFAAPQWGIPGDVPVPGDYDGDRRADVAAYRPSDGVWYIVQSSNGAVRAVQFGSSGETTVPADYDGDGRTDLGLYDPATHQWRAMMSSTDYTNSFVFNWGQDGDVPVPADYDGDGKVDIAVYRPSTGEWVIHLSSGAYGGNITVSWGLTGDVPVPADFDGDGRADVVAYRPSDGNWFVLDPITGAQRALGAWGLAEDKALPQDFDADGVADQVVFRPSNGYWFARLSTGGFLTIQWGVSTDMPMLRGGGL
jgi:hypothetical protein